MIDKIPEPSIISNRLGGIKLVKQAFLKAFGYDESEVIGQKLNMLMPEQFALNHDSFIQNYLTTGKEKIIGTGCEVKAKKKNGELFSVYAMLGDFEYQ